MGTPGQRSVRQRESGVEDVVGDVVDVLCHCTLASTQEGHGSGASDQPQRRPWIRPVLEQADQLGKPVRRRVSGREHQPDRVVGRCLGDHDSPCR